MLLFEERGREQDRQHHLQISTSYFIDGPKMNLFNPTMKFEVVKSREKGSVTGRWEVRVGPNNAAFLRRRRERSAGGKFLLGM